MTQTESDILRDAFLFLKAHGDPPPTGGTASEAFWKRTADDLTAAGEKWDNHPLALEVFPAVYGYIETKQKMGA